MNMNKVCSFFFLLFLSSITILLANNNSKNVFSDGVNGTIRFHSNKKEVFPSMEAQIDWYTESISAGYSMGVILDGPYAGAELISAEFVDEGPCKGEGCNEKGWVRFAKKGSELVYLKKNSSGWMEVESWIPKFSKLGLSLTKDYEYSLNLFYNADKIEHKSHEFKQIILEGRIPKNMIYQSYSNTLFMEVCSLMEIIFMSLDGMGVWWDMNISPL